MTIVDSRNGITPAGAAGQATIIEQTRAAAEVHAAIVVAQQCPRNVPRAIEAMRESCGRKELAERAFFAYPRGDGTVTGTSVHLARELARVWGNIQYGLSELRRDSEQSELLAYAWDVQTNTRCASIIINPHRLYTGGRKLSELRDVYENNANVGARRVREAILDVLPAWFVEEAVERCYKTLNEGNGKPLPIRIAGAIEVFGNLGITLAQLEAKIGSESTKWEARDVAQLLVIHRSLIRGELHKDEAFPPVAARVTVDGITPAAPAAQPASSSTASNEGTKQEAAPAQPDPTPPGSSSAGQDRPQRETSPSSASSPSSSGPAEQPQPRFRRLTKPTLGKLKAELLSLPLGGMKDTMDAVSALAGRPVKSAEELSQDEAEAVLKVILDTLKTAQGDKEEAAGKIWEHVRGILTVQAQDASAEAAEGEVSDGGA